MVVLMLVPSEMDSPLPEPRLEMARTSPEAEPLDWVKPKTEPVSVPEPEMLEVNCTKLAVSFKEPAELVTTVRLARTSARESAAVRVPDRFSWASLTEVVPSRVAIKAPVPFGFRVKAPLAPVVMLRAPASAMALVLNVWVPITEVATKLATPAAVTLQLSSVIETVVAAALPMVMVLATASEPIVIVFAVVPPSPMWTVSAPVPVPTLMVLAKLEEPKFMVPPASKVSRVTTGAPLVVVIKK